MTLDYDYSNLIVGQTRDPLPVTSRDEARAALAQLLSQARMRVDIVSRELDPGLFNIREITEPLRKLALSHRHARIRILVQEPGRLTQTSHALIELSRRLSTYFAIRVLQGEYRKYNGAFVLVDRAGFIFQHAADRYDGEVCAHDRRKADEFGRLADDMWETAQPDPNLRAISI